MEGNKGLDAGPCGMGEEDLPRGLGVDGELRETKLRRARRLLL